MIHWPAVNQYIDAFNKGDAKGAQSLLWHSVSSLKAGALLPELGPKALARDLRSKQSGYVY